MWVPYQNCSWDFVNVDYNGIFNILVNETTLLQSICFYFISMPLARWLFGYGTFYKNNKALCKRCMFVYNIIMSGFSGWVMINCCIYLWENNFNFQSLSCDIFIKNEKLHWCMELFFYSKQVEYIDSWLLTLRDRPVSVLQWYHHAGIVCPFYFAYYFKLDAAMITMALNSFIHTVMYFYYAVSVYVKKIPMKPLLTTMQLTQFFIGLYLSAIALETPCVQAHPYKSLIIVWSNVYCCGVVILFFNFYVRNYVLKQPKKKRS